MWNFTLKFKLNVNKFKYTFSLVVALYLYFNLHFTSLTFMQDSVQENSSKTNTIYYIHRKWSASHIWEICLWKNLHTFQNYI